MVKLLLIADDFTGALDTGIQFAKYGAATRMLTSSEIDEDLWQNKITEVLVVDTETRHLNARESRSHHQSHIQGKKTYTQKRLQ